MRAVIQRTTESAVVSVDDKISGQIEKGLVIYLGIEAADTKEDIEWLARKICNLRIFSDEEGKMNLSVGDINGGLLIISQFTLFASTKKGNRPSYLRSAKPDYAVPKYEAFLKHLRQTYDLPVEAGIFGADMQVRYTNDGPVTIIIDTKNKE